MTFDICFVTYNSSGWLENCIKSFSKVNYDTKKLALHFTDNSSNDDTIDVLEKLKEKYAHLFLNFNIIKSNENLGFAKGSNLAAKMGNADIVFFCNVDVEIDENAFIEIEKAILENEDFDAFEMRQFPHEHPKIYNPITLEVEYASAAALFLKRDLFVRTGGFDESIFMYCEDVDLSYRIRLLGSKIKYVPLAIINHYTYKQARHINPIQESGRLIGNYILRAKYLPKNEFKKWEEIKNNKLTYFKNEPKVEQLFNERIKKAKAHTKQYREFYKNNVKNSRIDFSFNEIDYGFSRGGEFYENSKINDDYTPLITVIVRTYEKPESLEKCLESLINQTYKNFEVIVCEDGENPCSKEVSNKFKDKLNIVYYAMNENTGKCLTANKAIEIAKGEYLNLLDDDDFFFPEHLEVVVSNIQKNRECKMFVTGAIEIRADSYLDLKNSYSKLKLRNIMPKTVDLLSMVKDNCMPVQAVTFHHSLPKLYGVFDNKFINAYEDWELWVRYVANTKCIVINKATSLYCIPLDENKRSKRAFEMQKNLPLIKETFSQYNLTVNAINFFEILYSDEMTEHRMQELDVYIKLNRSYVEIINSTTWKRLSLFRKLATFIEMLFMHILLSIKQFNKTIFGPLDLSEESRQNNFKLSAFIIDTQNSLLFKLFVKMINKYKK